MHANSVEHKQSIVLCCSMYYNLFFIKQIDFLSQKHNGVYHE